MGGRKDGAREGCEVVAPTPSTRVVDGVTETARVAGPGRCWRSWRRKKLFITVIMGS